MVNKTLFAPARYKKYADIIDITDINEAKKSISKLKSELKGATIKKKARIKKIAIYTSNRCLAMANMRNIMPNTRREKITISKLFKSFGDSINIRGWKIWKEKLKLKGQLKRKQLKGGDNNVRWFII